MSKKETVEKQVVNVTDNDKLPTEDIKDVLARLRELEERDAIREAEIQRLRQVQQEGTDEETVENTRKPAQILKLVSVDGKPVIDCKLKKTIKTDGRGNKYNAGMEAHLTVYGRKDVFITSYGNLENPDDFLNLPRIDYQLVDQNEADLTGASHVEYNKVVSQGDFIDEVDRSTGVPIKTGRKVQLKEKTDFRYYTILVDGEKVTLAQDKIYR